MAQNSESMLGLFRQDVVAQATLLEDIFLALQKSENEDDDHSAVLKASQYIINSSKLVQVAYAVNLGHAIFDLVKKSGSLEELSVQQVTNVLQGIEFLKLLSEQTDDGMSSWYDDHCMAIREYLTIMSEGGEGRSDGGSSSAENPVSTPHKEAFSMFDLFQAELAQQQDILSQNILALEASPQDESIYARIEKSLGHVKKASQFIKVNSAIQLSDMMSRCIDKFSSGSIPFEASHSESLLLATHVFDGISKIEEAGLSAWVSRRDRDIQKILQKLKAVMGESDLPVAVDVDVVEPPANLVEPELSPIDELNLRVGTQIEQLVSVINQLFLDQTDVADFESAQQAVVDIGNAAKAIKIDWAIKLSEQMLVLFNHAVESKEPFTDVILNWLGQGADYFKQFTVQFSDQLESWTEMNENNISDVVGGLRDSIESSFIPHEEVVDESDVVGAPAESAQVAAAPAKAQMKMDAAEVNAVDIGAINITADDSLMELFRVEVEGQSKVLSEALLELEADPSDTEQLEVAMRAAHSVKGAARMVGIEPVVRLSHVMEDVFVAAQEGKLVLTNDQVDIMLSGLDMIIATSEVSAQDASALLVEHGQEIKLIVLECRYILEGKAMVKAVPEKPAESADGVISHEAAPATGDATQYRKVTKRTSTKGAVSPAKKAKVKDNAIRVSAQSLNRLMGLAGESLIESRWVRPFLDSMLMLKRHQVDMISALDSFRETCVGLKLGENVESQVRHIQEKAAASREEVVGRISDMEDYERRATNLAARLNREVIASRMRPFSDGVHGFRRMVRDVAKSLEKDINFEVHGLATQVDRDILEQIEAPLSHVLRNAIDHGIEMPDDREAAGKPRQATIRLEALHASGMLSISVSDDGCGIDVENIRKKILDRKLASEEMTDTMTKSELLDFLFLPSFSTKEQVTEISGRGVGLDVVHSAMQEMRGSVRITTKIDEGTKFHLQLPLTLSVVRALTVEISGEPYAFPLARVEHTLRIPKEQVQMMEGRRYFTMGNQHIGVIQASQILGMHGQAEEADDYSMVLVGERLNRYGLIVDRFLGERALVVHALDVRLGKVKDISSASIMDDGTPVLIIDVDDMILSIDNMVSGGRLGGPAAAAPSKKVDQLSPGGPQRVLVVDDSITVREVERNMLEARGYDVEVAVDGADGWNAVRTNYYDLIISDIDMPRMNGFEFVGLVKSDANYASIPVMIVSYKDREEDRIKGMEAGADYYLTKGSFEDDTLIDAVVDLIGEA